MVWKHGGIQMDPMKALVGIHLLLLSVQVALASQLLVGVNLGSSTTDEIHRMVIAEQIRIHQPPLQSIRTRRTKSLDGMMDFCLDPSRTGLSEGWQNANLRSRCRERNFHLMPVPAAFNEITNDERVKNFMGWVWYQTTVELEEPSEEWNWMLQFESANYMALVWAQKVGGSSIEEASLVGLHVGGHLPFTANISDLVWSSSEDSGISLRVTIAISNQLSDETIPSGRLVNLSDVVGREFFQFEPDFDFFHFSGLIGSVILVQLPRIYLKRVDQLMEADQLTFDVCLSQPLNEIGATSVQANLLLDGDRPKWIEASIVPSVKSICCLRASFNSSNIAPWISGENLSSKMANLYKVRFSSLNPTSTRDIVEFRVGLGSTRLIDSQFGLVTQKSSPKRRLQLQGFGMHHEQAFSGRSMSLAAISKDLNLLKWIGANVIRTSHYPYSSDYLDLCDQFGILVIAECQAVGLNSFSESKLRLHEQLLLEMMERDQNHPSIVAWSVANEPRSELEDSQAYFESLLHFARNRLAPFTGLSGRLLTAAIAQPHSVDRIGHTLDLIMLNHYFGWYQYPGVLEAIRLPLISSLSGWSARYGKPILVSEFGADSISGQHSLTADLFSEEYQRDLLVEHEAVFEEIWRNQEANETKVNFWGSMIWNFADFSTHHSLLRVAGNRKGVFSRDRTPKLAAEMIREVYLSGSRARIELPQNSLDGANETNLL